MGVKSCLRESCLRIGDHCHLLINLVCHNGKIGLKISDGICAVLVIEFGDLDPLRIIVNIQQVMCAVIYIRIDHQF